MITIHELMLEIEDIKQKSIETLKEMHAMKISDNCFGAGWENGAAATCQQLLDLIKESQNE